MIDNKSSMEVYNDETIADIIWKRWQYNVANAIAKNANQ